MHGSTARFSVSVAMASLLTLSVIQTSVVEALPQIGGLGAINILQDLEKNHGGLGENVDTDNNTDNDTNSPNAPESITRPHDASEEQPSSRPDFVPDRAHDDHEISGEVGMTDGDADNDMISARDQLNNGDHAQTGWNYHWNGIHWLPLTLIICTPCSLLLIFTIVLAYVRVWYVQRKKNMEGVLVMSDVSTPLIMLSSVEMIIPDAMLSSKKCKHQVCKLVDSKGNQFKTKGRTNDLQRVYLDVTDKKGHRFVALKKGEMPGCEEFVALNSHSCAFFLDTDIVQLSWSPSAGGGGWSLDAEEGDDFQYDMEIWNAETRQNEKVRLDVGQFRRADGTELAGNLVGLTRSGKPIVKNPLLLTLKKAAGDMIYYY